MTRLLIAIALFICATLIVADSGAIAQFFCKSNLFIKTDVCFYSAIAIVSSVTDTTQA
jgi:hypothetical protein